ncbi:glutamate receptor ionotropic, kainate 2-like [Diachasmimorpha longicaudata]|uniref:glutamate receptor ionotropic, kainate 2-like n=1 Tax=Diachasmimorpha longicaudata TaxID=58733 RepID=UPI0030B877C6
MNLCVSLAVFNMVIGTALLVEALNKETCYGSLLKNVYDQYQTAGVIITMPEALRRTFTVLAIQYNTLRMLFNEGISVVVNNFVELKERFTSYTHRTGRPLIITVFTTMEDVYTFQQIVKNVTISYPIWLMLFIGHISPDVCDYCREPRGNLLNLKFNSQVLVLCCESDVIVEWWSLTGDHTKRQEIGRWMNDYRRIEWIKNETLYSRRNSLEGRGLRIAITKRSSYIWEKDGEYFGLFGEFLNELSETMNFTISEVFPEDFYGSWDPKTAEWSGLIGRIQRNEADIGVSPIAMTHGRLNVVDFTIPMVSGETRLYVRKLDGARVRWQAYFKAFAVDVWVAIIGLILTMPLFLTLIRYRRGNHLFPQIVEHYLNVWGIYCQQGLSSFPDETPLRIVYLSLFISTVISASVYSASLVSFLTVFSSYSPFNTREEFASDGSYGLIVVVDSAQYDTYKSHTDPLSKRMMSLMKPKDSLPYNTIEGFDQLCREKVAFEVNEAQRMTILNSMFCEITSIRTGAIETFGMITPQQSEYLEFINYRIRQFKYTGMFQRIKYRHMVKILNNPVEFPDLHMEGFTPILLILITGFLITLIIFLTEIVFKELSRKLNDWKMQKMIEVEIEKSRFSQNVKK